MNAPVEIPTRSDLESYSAFIELEGRTYSYALRFNLRAGAWFLTWGDADGDPILSGLRVVVDTPFFYRFSDSRLPPGQLSAYDTSGTQEDPGELDLSRRVKLLYIPVGDA